jgi:hypothetical protein
VVELDTTLQPEVDIEGYGDKRHFGGSIGGRGMSAAVVVSGSDRYNGDEHEEIMQRYTIAYLPELGKPEPTPDEVFRLLGLSPLDRPDLWKLLTHFASSTANLVIVGAPTDLGATPFEAALVLRLCASRQLSVHIVASKTQLVAALPETTSERVYQTTADFAELAAQLLAPPTPF